MQNKGNTAKTKAAQKKAPRKTLKSQKPKLSASQKARLRQIEEDAKTNLSATVNALEELTESNFIRTAIQNAITEQAVKYGLPEVRHGESISSVLEQILRFGPVIDEVKASEIGPPSIERISYDDLIALTDRIGATHLFEDREGALLFCGLLQYFERLSRSAEANYLDDDIYAVTQRLFHQSLHGSDGADKFSAQAYDSLRSNLKTLGAV